MGLKIGVAGVGRFSPSFVRLFKHHPLVEEVCIAELDAERRQGVCEMFGITRSYDSLEELCKSDVDAIGIFTQRHLHGPHTLQALRAGKHVYCAVPMGQTLEEIEQIISEVKASGLIYMTGETSYYYPSTIYCRDRYQKGDFGDFVYAEAQYFHDMSHDFYEAYQHSGGPNWRRVAGIPPMNYPTHSISMVVSVTHSYVEKVSCLGYRDQSGDGVFGEGKNNWDNPYSNETALARMSDGGICRFNEFRRIGWTGNNGVHMSMYGTQGSFEEHAHSQIWTTVSDKPIEVTAHLKPSKSAEKIDHTLHPSMIKDFHSSYAEVHNVKRLPEQYYGLPNGHFGSHHFLADDFVRAVSAGALPPNHAWNAAKYCAPGLVAHQSAMRDGEWMAVPDFGEPPASWKRWSPETDA